MTITPDQAMSFAEEATLKVETLTHIEKDHVFYSLVSDDGHTVATDLDKGDAELLAIAPDLAHTIAGMRWEYSNQYRLPGETRWRTQKWEPTPERARTHAPYYWVDDPKDMDYRLVCRLVGPVEVTE